MPGSHDKAFKHLLESNFSSSKQKETMRKQNLEWWHIIVFLLTTFSSSLIELIRFDKRTIKIIHYSFWRSFLWHNLLSGNEKFHQTKTNLVCCYLAFTGDKNKKVCRSIFHIRLKRTEILFILWQKWRYLLRFSHLKSQNSTLVQ